MTLRSRASINRIRILRNAGAQSQRFYARNILQRRLPQFRGFRRLVQRARNRIRLRRLRVRRQFPRPFSVLTYPSAGAGV